MTEYALDPDAGIAYARRWAFSRNPAYYDFDDLGGDCTNFVSQCLYAAGAEMNFTKDTGWYYRDLNDRAAAWTGVGFFYRFLTQNNGVGPFGREIPVSVAAPGDVIQLGDGNRFYHSLYVVSRRDGLPFVAAHSFDAFDRPLSSYHAPRARALRIEGRRRD